jgi:hypothetical protein
MDRDTWLRLYDAAPQSVQFYLLNQTSTENEDKAKNALGYENDAWDRVMDLVWETVFAHLPKEDFLQGIKNVANQRDAREVERQVLMNVVYPMADLVAWDVDARLQEIGVPAAALASLQRLSLRPVSYGAAVRRIASQAKISLLAEEYVRRLRDVFVSFLKGVRTIEQVREVLRRPQVDAGLGFSQDQVDAFVNTMNTFLQTVEVKSEEEYGRWFLQMQREAELKRVEEETLRKQEANKARDSAEETSEEQLPGVTRVPTVVASALDQGIEEAWKLIAPPELDAYLQKRLRNVISTRLRDVRTSDQAREIILRDAKVGGLGQTPEAGEKMIAGLEQVYTEFHEKIATDEKRQVDTLVQRQQATADVRREQEKQAHAAWYQEKMQAIDAGEGGTVAALKAVLRRIVPVGPTTPVPGLTMPVVASNGGDRSSFSGSRLDSIQGVVRLKSLTEELQDFGLEEFRRLAKDPDKAAEKIKQKLEALKQESFDRWSEGVRGWRQSPLQQMYLALVAEAFAKATPVAELAETHYAADPRSLRADEVGAIMQLNSQLPF